MNNKDLQPNDLPQPALHKANVGRCLNSCVPQYTEKEMVNIMDNAGFPKGLSLIQMIKIAYWSMFDRRRLNRFCWNIERGMSLYFAFNDAV